MQIELVISNLEIHPNIDIIQLHIFCEENNIPIKTRFFDSWSFSRDRKYVESLPAIHILQNKRHIQTLYNNPQCLYTLRNLLDKERHPKKNVLRLFDLLRNQITKLTRKLLL